MRFYWIVFWVLLAVGLGSIQAQKCTKCPEVKVTFSCGFTEEYIGGSGGGYHYNYAYLNGATFASAPGDYKAGETQLKPFEEYWISVNAGCTYPSFRTVSCFPSVSIAGESCYVVFFDGVESRGQNISKPGGVDSWKVKLMPPENKGGGSPGNGGARKGSVDWYASFGDNAYGSGAGSIYLHENNVTAALYSPEVLKTTVPTLSETTEVIRNGSAIRQIKTLQSFADVVTVSSTKYEVRFYLPSQVGSKSNGVYTVAGQPFKIWRMTNPDTSSTNRFNVSEISGSIEKNYSFMQDVSAGKWVFTINDGMKVEEETEIINSTAGTRTVTKTTLGGSPSALLKKTVDYYQNFPWGEQYVKYVQDPDDVNLITDYIYFTDSSDTNNYKKLKAVTNPDGSWEKYLYYSLNEPYYGKVWKTYKPYKNLPANYDQATESNCKVTETQYGFSKSVFPDYVRYQTEKINGTIVSQKSWELYDENFLAPNGISYNTTVKNEFQYYGPGEIQGFTYQKLQTYSATAHFHGVNIANPPPASLVGKTAAITYPDGRIDTYWYESGKWDPSSRLFAPDPTGTAYREIVTHGTKENPMGIPYQTTRTVTISNNLAYHSRDEEQVYTGSGYETVIATDYLTDAQGNVIETRKNGRVIQTATYISGQKISEQDETGMETSYTYDSLGNPASTIQKGAAATAFSSAQPDKISTTVYDSLGRLSSSTVTAGALSQTSSTTYDRAGRIESETAQGLTTWRSYWNGGRNRQVTQPNGATQITETYLDGRTKSVTGTAQIPQYFDYGVDPVGNQWTLTSVNSSNSPRSTKTTVDQLGREVIAEIPAFGGGTPLYHQSFYDNAGRLFRLRQSGKPDQITIYDNAGNVFRTGLDIDGDGVLNLASMDRISETQTTYEKTGTQWYRVSLSRNYLQDNLATPTTTIQKESLGLLMETLSFNEFQQLTRQETKIDRTAKKVTQTTDTPDSTIDAVSISINGRLVSQSSSTISTPTTYRYDSFDRLTQTTFPDGTSTQQAYNADGLPIAQTDTAGNTTRISYYAQTELGAGQPKQVTNPDGTSITYQYDSLGHAIQVSGSSTYPVDYEFNTYGEQTKMFTYRSASSVGNKAQGDLTTWNYDPATGRLLSKTDADSKAVNYNYFPSGQLKTRTWARGVITTYSYNFAGDLTGVTYSDSTPAMTNIIGRSGQATQITDGSGIRNLPLSPSGLPTGTSYSTGIMNGLSVSYTYDTNARLNSITAGGRTTTYNYSNEGRLSTVTHQGSTATYGYKPNSDLLKTTTLNSGGITRLTTTRNFDSANRVNSIVNTPGTGAVISRAYTYNSRNQRTQSTLANGDYWKYDYNPKGEVISGVKKNASNQNLLGHDYSYTFDEIGNRLKSVTNSNQSDYTANSLNQYNSRTVPPLVELLGTADPAATVTVNGTPTQRQSDLFLAQIPVDNSAGALYNNYVTIAAKNNVDANGKDAEQQSAINYFLPKTPEAFTYDFDGNVTSDGRFNYTWDGENRLIRVESFPTAPATSKRRVDFIYDAQSRRVSKKSYTWNGTAWVLADSRRFLYDQFNLLAEINDDGAVLNSYAWGTDLSGSLYGAGGVGGLLIVGGASSSESSYATYDANGNILAYVSNTGSVTAQFEYGPFGELIRSSGTPPCNFGFSTKYRDSETGLNYYGYRYYSSGLGRWLGRDPIEEQGGLNLYGFCGNDGINGVDRLGLWETTDALKAAWQFRNWVPQPFSNADAASQEAMSLFNDFENGTGSSFRNFGEGSALVSELKRHSRMEQARKEIKQKIKERYQNGNFEDFEQNANYNFNGVMGKVNGALDVADLALFKRSIAVILGSFGGKVYVWDIRCPERKANLTFTVWNDMSFVSWKRNAITGKPPEGTENPYYGPFKTIHMEMYWDEMDIDF